MLVSYTLLKSLSGREMLALEGKVQCNGSVSTGQNIKGFVLMVLLTENKPTEVSRCITSSFVSHDSDSSGVCGAVCLAC